MITIKDIESVLALFTEDEKENMMILGNSVYVNFPSVNKASEKAHWIVDVLKENTLLNYSEWEDIGIGSFLIKSKYLDFIFSFGFTLKGVEVK